MTHKKIAQLFLGARFLPKNDRALSGGCHYQNKKVKRKCHSGNTASNLGKQYNYLVLKTQFMVPAGVILMECPKCAAVLVKKYYKGMLEVDYCPNCRGMWLDFDELDRLEDVAFDDDAHKGSLIHREIEVPGKCPVCALKLHEFQYRLYDLKLDYCTEKHGFWLDAGEDERVLQIMLLQQTRIGRKKEAETEWKHLLKGLHSFIKKT